MAKVLNDASIPDTCGVGVEYGIPQSSKRIDLLLSGRDETGRGNLMIVELKQWESARRTDMDGLVRTRFAEGEANTGHPSYQSWSYAELLRAFNETVDQDQVPLQPCAYLHNCQEGGDLLHPFYAHYVKLAPVLLGGRRGTHQAAQLHRPPCARGWQGRTHLPRREWPDPADPPAYRCGDDPRDTRSLGSALIWGC
ncbi:MAG: hypothetical protein U1F39_05450 [Steroidobacteraceae bacterium]